MSRLGSPDPHLPLSASDQEVDFNFLALPEIEPEDTAPPQEPVPSISADLLNDIVERCRISTNASDAAIALRHENDLICFATTGPNAPDIGVRLDLDSGLSGACAQAKIFQRCDDSETDGRVDAQLCRRLGIRSILVFPILRHDDLLGVVEVFSERANAFGDPEVQKLATLSRTVGYILDRAPDVEERAVAVEAPETAPAAVENEELLPPVSHVEEPLADASETDADEPADVEPPTFVPAPTARIVPVVLKPVRQDYWTTVLTMAVIALAVALGWLLGESVTRDSSPVAQQTESAPPSPAARPKPTDSANIVGPKQVTLVPSDQKPPSPAKKHETALPESAQPGELVVSQNGKVIYRQAPLATTRQEDVATTTPKGISKAVMISPETANQYLLQRVEPEYPELAREQHISGPVTLQAVVAKDGMVKTLKTISGDPLLADAARSAVSQWRFKPFTQAGTPSEFQTSVTVNFRLP